MGIRKSTDLGNWNIQKNCQIFDDPCYEAINNILVKA